MNDETESKSPLELFVHQSRHVLGKYDAIHRLIEHRRENGEMLTSFDLDVIDFALESAVRLHDAYIREASR